MVVPVAPVESVVSRCDWLIFSDDRFTVAKEYAYQKDALRLNHLWWMLHRRRALAALVVQGYDVICSPIDLAVLAKLIYFKTKMTSCLKMIGL